MSPVRVTRGGDFQTIDFGAGLSVYAGSIQDGEGYWMDNPLIDVLEAHADEIDAWIVERTSIHKGSSDA